ncbi:MAG: hypothetical protein RIA72_15235 [Sphingopyxis sp.]
MLQVAAALLFALAAGLGVLVILAMLRNNSSAVVSALLGEGAFPVGVAPQSDPLPQKIKLRRSSALRGSPRAVPSAVRAQRRLSCAA